MKKYLKPDVVSTPVLTETYLLAASPGAGNDGFTDGGSSSGTGTSESSNHVQAKTTPVAESYGMDKVGW
jgi:hypothetical protein